MTRLDTRSSTVYDTDTEDLRALDTSQNYRPSIHQWF